MPEVKHVDPQPDQSAERIQKQVHHLESPPGGEDLVELVRESVEQDDVKHCEELPARELSPPHQRPRQKVRQDGVLEDMGQPAEVEDQRLTKELCPPQPAVQPVWDVAVGVGVTGDEEDESRPEEHGQPAGEEGFGGFEYLRIIDHG